MLSSQCIRGDGNETLQQKLTLGAGTGGGEETQWVFERASFLNLQRQEESNVPSVSAQSAFAGYDLSMILNGRDIFSLHIPTFCDGSENPPQPYESYFAAVQFMQFNGNPVSFPRATNNNTAICQSE